MYDFLDLKDSFVAVFNPEFSIDPLDVVYDAMERMNLTDKGIDYIETHIDEFLELVNVYKKDMLL